MLGGFLDTASEQRTSTIESKPDRVLLVDDEPLVLLAYSRTLRAAGFAVDVAADGLAAVTLIEAHGYDVVVSDIAMPGMDGIDLLRRIRSRDSDVPVILMSGFPRLESAIEAVENGALLYLVKPFEGASLLSAVERACRLRKVARIKEQALAALGRSSTPPADRSALEAQFDAAIRGLRFDYQPIVSASKRRPIAWEALARFDAPALGRPDAFFEAAERLGRVGQAGSLLRERAAADARGLKELLFVNLHPLDLLEDGLFSPSAPLSRIASRVVLEITERASMDPITDVADRVAALRKLGFRIALDDLGAGYAGLTSIAQLQPEFVKIDIALVRNLDRDPLRTRIVRGITVLCRDLHIQVIAEGIESIGERDALLRCECDLFQGFLFGRPGVPFPEMLPLALPALCDPPSKTLGDQPSQAAS